MRKFVVLAKYKTSDVLVVVSSHDTIERAEDTVREIISGKFRDYKPYPVYTAEVSGFYC